MYEALSYCRVPDLDPDSEASMAPQVQFQLRGRKTTHDNRIQVLQTMITLFSLTESALE